MNVTICKEMRMAVAHDLPYHAGACRRLHGHTYVVRIYVNGPVQEVIEGNSQSGMVTDFGIIKEFLNSIEEQMDHCYVNETLDPYPTAERLAVRILNMANDSLAPRLPEGARVLKVRVYEEYVAPQAFAEIANA